MSDNKKGIFSAATDIPRRKISALKEKMKIPVWTFEGILEELERG